MPKRQGLTRVLAIAGTTLLWLPLILIVVVTVRGAPKEVGWLPLFVVGAMDVFPAVVLGGLLLLGAAILARSHRGVIGLSVAAPIISIVSGMVWSQPIPEGGWPLVITIVMVAAFWLGLAIAGVAGADLTRSLFSRFSVQTA
jgi:hypothetical protein